MTLVPEFSNIYHYAQLVRVEYDELPERIMSAFESRSRLFVHPNAYRPRQFDALLRLTRENGPTTWILSQTKTYSEIQTTERLTYFVEIAPTDVLTLIEVRLALDSETGYFRNKPFIGSSLLFAEAELGESQLLDRVRLATAYIASTEALPLYSDTVLDDREVRFYQSLVRDGVATCITEGCHQRFVVLPKPSSAASTVLSRRI